MDKNTINEDETFEINPDHYVSIEYFGEQKVKVVVVDDFYKNPMLVRQLALDIPASRNRRIRGNNPAWRINAFYDMDKLSWIYDQLTKKYRLGRVRLLLKEPRSTLSWHRDPEPRLHIPIYTNPGAIMVIDHIAKHMPADGSVWITNNTKYHNAFNGGEENRVHLVACVLDYKFN